MIDSSKQTRTNMFAVVWKHCGMVNISSHYEVAMVLSIYALVSLYFNTERPSKLNHVLHQTRIIEILRDTVLAS